MENVINKITTALSTTALFVLGGVMAGLGLAAIGVLALFAFIAMGIGLLAAPFLAAQHPHREDAS